MRAALLDETRDVSSFIANDAWCAEEKLNGRRMILVKRGGVVRCYSRTGIEYVAPLSVVDTARTVLCDVTLDGELVGEEFFAFDILRLFDADISHRPFEERRCALSTVAPFHLVEHATGGQDKTTLFHRVLASDGEGVVFKRLDGLYQPGQRTYGVKFKFYRTATFAVVDVDLADSTLGLMRDGRDCGRVSFPFAVVWPRVGELWDVRFDGVSRDGELIRPALLMRRDDLGSDARAAAWWW